MYDTEFGKMFDMLASLELMRSSAFSLTRLLVFSSIFLGPIHAADTANSDLDRKFTQSVKPFLNTYCIGCHSGSSPAAQFDLRPYSNTAAVIRDYPRWNLVLEKLASQEMPPKQMKQPPADARQEVIHWVQEVRADEARRNAGDPGVVLARRLSNSEYNYTIRDLTGVDIRPTREFPVDPANTAGFDNSGESLTMSPALLNKYLQAAREVANHMVLKPDGFAFAPHPMLVETDRENTPSSGLSISTSASPPTTRITFKLPGATSIERFSETARPLWQAPQPTQS